MFYFAEFPYTSRRYLETGDFRYMLGGNSPLIVDRAAGSLTELGTALPTEDYIAHYETHRSGMKQWLTQLPRHWRESCPCAGVLTSTANARRRHGSFRREDIYIAVGLVGIALPPWRVYAQHEPLINLADAPLDQLDATPWPPPVG